MRLQHHGLKSVNGDTLLCLSEVDAMHDTRSYRYVRAVLLSVVRPQHHSWLSEGVQLG